MKSINKLLSFLIKFLSFDSFLFGRLAKSRSLGKFWSLVSDLLTILTWPFRFVFGVPYKVFRSFTKPKSSSSERLVFSDRKTIDIIWGLPAVLVFVSAASITILGFRQQSSVANRYYSQGTKLLKNDQPVASQMYLKRALSEDSPERLPIMLELARAYDESGDKSNAGDLMNTLAPPGAVGFPVAHRFMALKIANQISENRTVGNPSDWLWHLRHSDQKDSSEIQKAWGIYYLIVGDIDNAIVHYKNAAQEQPEIWLQIAELESKRNQVDEARVALSAASKGLEKVFRRDPKNFQVRLMYATSLFYSGKLPQAEGLLKQSLELKPEKHQEKSFRQLLAAVFVRMHDVEVAADSGFEKAFQFLQRALDYDPHYQPTLTRLVSLAELSEEKKVACRNSLRNIISDGKASAMAHFALGSLEFNDGNVALAKIHINQALALNSKMPILANNLAYLMAQSDDKDLESALELANGAVESDRSSHEFLDTRAFIFRKLGRYSEAAVDYQLALEMVGDDIRMKTRIQKELSEIFEEIGDEELAAKYLEASKSN